MQQPQQMQQQPHQQQQPQPYQQPQQQQQPYQQHQQQQQQHHQQQQQQHHQQQQQQHHQQQQQQHHQQQQQQHHQQQYQRLQQQQMQMQMQHQYQGQYRRESRDEAEDTRAGNNTTCGICYEPIDTKPGEKRFGMLENCDHFFCLDCIREWRKTGADAAKPAQKQNVRLCPVCRVESFVVIPADRHVCGEEKTAIMKEYKGNMITIPCKFWDHGRGSCSFGASCFYAHCNPDGTRYVPPPQRSMMSDSGKTRVLETPTLFDFFPSHN
eukprot:GEMP01034778.1.p1 GENE.GEMP01034778.1~~GEMP01034778.1.p1  ORF type:complete len:283 (+),score=101.53 GEMP01034778.1:51-851(+)